MKTIFLIVALIGNTIAYSNEVENNLAQIYPRKLYNNAVIHQLYEMMRSLIQTGSEEKGVPVLDPYHFNYTTVESSGQIFSVIANITNGIFSGLGDFYARDYVFNNEDITLNNKIIFPELKFTADYYEMEGSIKDAFPLAGRGKVDLEFHYITTISTLHLKLSNNNKSILIDRIESPRFYIEKIISHTDFDNNIDAIFNQMIADLLADYLNRFSGYITTVYNKPLVGLMNKILEKFDTWHILETI